MDEQETDNTVRDGKEGRLQESQEGGRDVGQEETARSGQPSGESAMEDLPPFEVPREDIVKRFWARVDKTGAGAPGYNGTPCWPWLGCLDQSGYGLCWNGKRVLRAHIFSRQLVTGKAIPKGLHHDHLCRYPPCTNPEHTEPVTCKVNVLRGVGSPAENSRKILCKRGHELDGRTKDGRRFCKTCNMAASKARYQANAEEIKAYARAYHKAKRQKDVQ